MQWLNVFIGLAVLFFGRRLFWFFVGCVGFLVGFEIAGEVLLGQPTWLILLIALGVGLLGALASIFLQRVFIVVAGFFAGGYCLSALAPAAVHMKGQGILWLAFAVGGLLGALLTAALLDPALIILSALAGATAVSQNVPLESSPKTVLFFVLLGLGVAAQSGQYLRDSRSRRPQRTQ